MIGVYRIFNNINGKSYIGVSNDIEKRWKTHKTIYDNPLNKEYQKTLYKAFRKYGLENFSFEVLEEFTNSEKLYEREKYWIKIYDSFENGYNDSEGGEFGSVKGHCRGESNGRAKLTEQDVIQIRIDYKNHITKQQSYSKFKDKITFGGFGGVWTGKTWSYIMPEVFSEENKKWHATQGKANAGERNGSALLTKEQILDIRNKKSMKEDKKEVYKKYSEIIAYSTFEQIWYNMTYKEDI